MKDDILDEPISEHHYTKEKARLFFGMLILFCFVCELLFIVEVVRIGNKDITGGVLKGIAILTSLLVFYFGFSWIKWIITPSLLLLSFACFLGANKNNSILMAIIGLYYFYIALLLPFSKKLKYLKRKS